MTLKTSLSATDFPIKSVKVFSCGEAEVTRVFPLDLTNCSNGSLVIEISKLPILLGALRPPIVTTGSADLVIMDYYHSDGNRKNLFGFSTPGVSSDVLRDLNAKCTSLEDERQLRQKSFAFLSTYMDSLAQGKVQVNEGGPAQLVAFFDDFVELGKSRSEIVAVLDQQIGDIQREIKDEITRLQREHISLMTTVTVVLAPVPTHTAKAELELVYRVKATCKPVHEVHITTDDGVPSSSAILNYRCEIFQSSGENWDDVELVVTTAKPDVPLVGLPEPRKTVLVQRFPQPESYRPPKPDIWTGVTPFWSTVGQPSGFLSVPQQMPQQASQHPALHFGSSLFGGFQGSEPASQGLFGSTLAQSRPDLGSSGSPLLPSQSQESSATTVGPPPSYPHSLFGGGTTTPSSYQPATSVQDAQTFTSLRTPAPPSPYQNSGEGIPLTALERDVTHMATAKAFIPSGVEAHHVLIATFSLKTSFMRIAVPAVDSRVFFICKITNTSNYTLLPGPVRTYLDGKHVSDSNITDAAQPQTIQCSLGVDSAVTTEMERRTADSEIAPSFAMTRKTHTITITAKNTHDAAIGDLIVRASLPVPQDPRIILSLREPVGLSMFDSATVSVRDGCSAKWLTTGEGTGRDGGMIEWMCRDVQPGLQVLKAAWDVTAPRDFDVIEQ